MATNPVITRANDGNFNGPCNLATGSFSTNAFDQNNVDYTIYLGFKPRYVKVINLTDRIEFEWFAGLASPGSIKTIAAGDKSIVAAEADGITILGPNSGDAVALVEDVNLGSAACRTTGQGGVTGNGFTMDEDIIVASKTYSWMALG